MVEDVQRLLHLYKERNVLVSALAAQPGFLKRRLWRLSLGMELVASPSLLLLDNLCEGGASNFLRLRLLTHLELYFYYYVFPGAL